MVDAGSSRRAFGIGAGLLGLGVAGVAVLATMVPVPRPAATPPPPARTLAPRATQALEPSFPSTPQELREVLSARTRLAPDRRALLAVVEVHRMQSSDPGELGARFESGRWRVAGAGLVGELPELAGFDDLVALVAGVARSVSALHPIGPAPADEGPPWPMFAPERPCLPTLAEAERRWTSGARHAGTVRLAARALVTLAVESPDDAQSADLLAARALAALAWLRAAGAADPEAEAVLARHMGYDAAARALAAPLDAALATRAWVLRDDDALAAMAARGDAPGARYLAWRRAVERGDAHGAEAAAARAEADASPLATAAFVAFEEPVTPERFAPWRAQPARVLQALEREAGLEATPRAPAELLPALAALPAAAPARGTFLDRELLVARARGAVQGALVDAVSAGLARTSTVGLTLQLVDPLGVATPDAFRDLALVAAHAAHVRAGTLGPDVALLDLASPSHLGAAWFVVAHDVVARALDPDDPRRRLAAERLAARLDARPAHRALAARVVGRALRDVVAVESACASLAREAPALRPDVTAWCLQHRGDLDGLDALARDVSLPASARADAAEALARVDVPAARAEEAWRAVADAGWWPGRRGYARWLAARGRSDEALALVTAPRRAPGQATPAMRVDEARVLRARGDASGALRALDRAGDEGLVAASGERALALSALGRFADAARAALDGVERRRDGDAVAVAAEVFWRGNDLDTAARVLSRGGVELTADDWRGPVAEAFARVFEAAPPELGERAFAALVRAGLPSARLRDLPPVLAARRRADVAARMLAHLDGARAPDAAATLDSLAQQFLCWRAVSGEAAARAWLRPRVAPERALAFAAAAYTQRADELLGVIAAPADAGSVARITLLRAAAAVRDEAGAARDELLRAVRAMPPSDDALLARHVLGDAPLTAVLPLARAPMRRAEVAYYAGLRAQGERRIAEAADWYQLAGLVSPGGPEALWAAQALGDLYGRAESLADIAASPWRRRAPGAPREAPAATTLGPDDEARAEAPAPRRGARGHRRREGHGRRRR